MRGFVVGSVALIVLYVALQPGAADKAQSGGSFLVDGLRRVLSSQVAGVPDRGAPKEKEAASGEESKQSLLTPPVPGLPGSVLA